MRIPKITGVDVLRALKEATRDWPNGAPFQISQGDANDLFTLTVAELVKRFRFKNEVASRIVADLATEKLNALGDALGVQLLVTESAGNLIHNAGIIRGAGAWADEPGTVEEMLEFFHRLRHRQEQ